jgi:hypothetical protein
VIERAGTITDPSISLKPIGKMSALGALNYLMYHTSSSIMFMGHIITLEETRQTVFFSPPSHFFFVRKQLK